MTGYLLLEGGAEFGGKMSEPDRRAMALAGGNDALISIIPTAAAPDRNHVRAGTNGVNWFRSLGATRVESLPIIDKASANDSRLVDILAQSRLIYMLGGFTGYLGETLKGSAAWDAMFAAYQQGAVIAGSSAGAMVMCEYYYDPMRGNVNEGLGLVPDACVIPHHNTFGKRWVAHLLTRMPDAVLLGIDERTGMIDDGEAGRKRGWHVYGHGVVAVFGRGKAAVYHHGQGFEEDFVK